MGGRGRGAGVDGVHEHPRSVAWITRLGERLGRCFGRRTAYSDEGPLSLSWPALALRSARFTAIVLGHGFARLLRLR